ncbi:TetR/AcrR family transcriptional regulator [Paenibacillus illinoisensis]|uniref:TetR/AcrR family transcriptional regulator n=1 Tax=Paenibacillus illinoisensis TaxID=59845 RepID=UPI001C8E40AF|nr:TetR/AcrR family transcriptional regulator [Paenibacillus illinoisensis]MBY0219949.1 TetR/AcrR family transcriptional regulator [Paenibacillus illinoisensis]
MRKQGVIGKESRLRLLEAATQEFALNGFYQTKISSIVARAGVTQPAFYLYFESKEAAFAELIDGFRNGLIQVVRDGHIEAGKNRDDLKEAVVESLSQIYRYLGENPALTRIGLYQSAESVRIKAEIAGLMEQNLIAEQQAGYYRLDLDTVFFAEALVAIVERLTLIKLLPGHETPSRLARITQDLFFYGILDTKHRD